MIDIKFSKGGIIIVNSILMGTPKKQAAKKLKVEGFGVKDDGDGLRVGLLANNIPPDSLDALHLNVNDLGYVYDGFAFHTHLSYDEAFMLQSRYVEMIDKFKIEKLQRGETITSSILYSYTNNLFKIEVARWREGGESADIPTKSKDYAVSVFITSLIEEIRTVADIKHFIYYGESLLMRTARNKYKQNTAFLYILLFNTFAIVVLFVCMLWPSKRTREPAEKKIGRYLYIDNANVLHTKNGCIAVYKERSMQPVEPILKEELNRQSLRRVCSKCVSEKQLDSLRWYVEYTDEGNDIDKDTWD